MPVPAYEMLIRSAPTRFGGRTRGPAPEQYRRRHDAKLDFGYNRLLGFINRTYGNYDEYVEFLHAWQQNFMYGPIAVATALGLNEATDRAFGWRAKQLKKGYRAVDWRFPVGFDTLSRIWR